MDNYLKISDLKTCIYIILEDKVGLKNRGVIISRKINNTINNHHQIKPLRLDI